MAVNRSGGQTHDIFAPDVANFLSITAFLLYGASSSASSSLLTALLGFTTELANLSLSTSVDNLRIASLAFFVFLWSTLCFIGTVLDAFLEFFANFDWLAMIFACSVVFAQQLSRTGCLFADLSTTFSILVTSLLAFLIARLKGITLLFISTFFLALLNFLAFFVWFAFLSANFKLLTTLAGFNRALLITTQTFANLKGFNTNSVVILDSIFSSCLSHFKVAVGP